MSTCIYLRQDVIHIDLQHIYIDMEFIFVDIWFTHGPDTGAN